MAEPWEETGVERRESPLMGEVSGVHAQLDRLEKQAARLRSKLEPVLSPVPEGLDEPSLEPVVESQANVEIRRAQKRIVAVVDQLTQTIDELQV